MVDSDKALMTILDGRERFGAVKGISIFVIFKMEHFGATRYSQDNSQMADVNGRNAEAYKQLGQVRGLQHVTILYYTTS